MRNKFIEYLVTAAKQDKNIYLLCGDLGYSVLEPFAEQFPDRFINVGIAEQNMIGIAAGLALSGKKVFVYSIVNFAITRCLEQIRNDVCYHNVDVTVVAVGGGLAYGAQGYTHLGIEDIAFTRSLPNMQVYIPADKIELEYCMNSILSDSSPKYLRLARGKEPDLHPSKITSPFVEVKTKNKINFLSIGPILQQACLAAEELEKHNINVGVYSCPGFSKLQDSEMFLELADSDLLVTVEEHLDYGGLGSYVLEILSANKNCPRIIRKGVKHETITNIGSQPFLQQQNQIDAKSLVKTVLDNFQEQRKCS